MLAAFTLGYGATGLTFYDQLVSQFFGTPAQCLLVTVVGVPAYRNRAGHGPGTPAGLLVVTKRTKPEDQDRLGYNEPPKAPEGEDFEAVMRALLDVPGQATSDEADDSDEAVR